MRSKNGSFVHHISTFTANLVWGVLPSLLTSMSFSSAARRSAVAASEAEAARPVARKERRGRDMVHLGANAWDCNRWDYRCSRAAIPAVAEVVRLPNDLPRNSHEFR